MKLTEGLMLGLIMGGIVTITINLMVAELQGATLRIYKDNIHQFVDVMNENKGRDFATYKDKLNSRINCIENQCSYTTQYKNEGIKNTDVVIQLDKNNKVPEKIIYKFNSIEMVNSDDKNTKKNVKRNQHFESASVQKFLSLFPVLCQEAGRKFCIVDKARSSVPVRCEGHVKALASCRY